jgi:hypothetical protein
LWDGTARLARNRGEGDIPLTAISTGKVDAIECVLRKMGIDDAEFTNPTGSGRIHVYNLNGARIDALTPKEELLTGGADGGVGAWNRYAQIIFACEGTPLSKSARELAAFVDYVNRGGRVFATHYRYSWLYTNSLFSTTADWQVNQQPNPVNPLTGTLDTSTSKGQDFASWLQVVGALSNPAPPQIQILDPRRDLNALRPSGGGQRWIYSETPVSVQHFTVDTPVLAAPDKVCGRVSFSDFHVINGINDVLTFPSQCFDTPLTPQEKVLEFMMLDLAACTGTTTPPSVPPPPPPP